MKNEINRIADRLVKAYNTNTVINPIPVKYCKNINLANKLRKLCEDQIKDETIGIKAGGTGIQVLKKLKEKEPFTAKVFNDFNPDSPARPFVWAGAVAVPAYVGYLRTKAGKHFLTDNIR